MGDRLTEAELEEIRQGIPHLGWYPSACRKLLVEIDAVRAERDEALADAQKWRTQEQLRLDREDAAERGGDW
jgi:hypothetical protein